MTANLQSLDFHGEVVYLMTDPESGKPFVPVKQLCLQLGIDWRGQHAKLTADRDLWRCGDISIPSPGGPQTMTCLPLENLNGWLFGIQAARVKPEFREKLRAYQKECFQALDAYWRTGAAIRPEVRAAAPEATRSLFDEIEALTGLDPEAAQPGGARPLTAWQTRCMEARAVVLGYLLELAQEMSLERAMARLVDDADAQRLPEAVQAAIPVANARAGSSGERTVSRRTLQRWMADERDGLDLAPLAPERPAPGWAAPFFENLSRTKSIAESLRQLQDQLPEGMPSPSYDAARRMARKGTAPASRPVHTLTGDLIQQLRSLFGDESARQSLRRMFPAYFLEGGAR